MVDTFTSLQFMRYLYLECSPEERQMLEECLSEDLSCNEEFKLLRDAKRYLPKALFAAHPNSLSRILEYSRLQA